MAATMVGWQRKRTAMWTFVVGMWVLRMALCLWPQYGYIHPDEFFQGLEPMAGAVFGYNVSLPWEFRNGVHPIRNVLFPSVSIGFPDAVMKLLFGAGGVSALSLVRVPRVFVCVLSYLVDAAMYFAAVEVGRDPLFPLLVLTTSHVMNVYAFRTLSNTMELIIFSLLLYRLARCYAAMDWQEELKASRPNRNRDPGTESERARVLDEATSRREAEDLAVLFVLGFFNRPTFLFFALPALAAYTLKDRFLAGYSLWNALGRFAAFVPAAASFMFMVSVLDTLFYRGTEGWADSGPVFTPWNFIVYNMNPGNLALHGVHRHWTHMFVNVPLLFGLLPFAAVHTTLTSWLPALVDGRPVKVDRRVDHVMMASFLFPLLFLSLFAHQEPRFLIPLIFPLVFAAHDKFFRPGPTAKVLVASWLAANALLTYFYGVAHQAGVPPMLLHVSRHAHRRPGHRLHLVSAYSYPMPQFLLKNTADSGYSFIPHDLGSTGFDEVVEFACKLERDSADLERQEILVALPGPMAARHLERKRGSCEGSAWARGRERTESVGYEYTSAANGSVTFCEQASFRPHVTTEYLPQVDGLGWSSFADAFSQLRLDLFSFRCS